ncbi:Translin [Trichodelitschia bisporula]|uniref:Translin n=1 Tax=Trichodelitschia bisporula TaxID=703511 RepID=A0A6G1HL39_9PEZI|nr:Translin [Trichodelitschia bisporula]
MATASQMVDPVIFANLQSKIDEEDSFRNAVRDIIQELDKQTKFALAILSRAHSTPAARIGEVTGAAEITIKELINTIAKLSETASQQPYYKFNYIWTRHMQDACFTILFAGWLQHNGKLFTIEEVGDILKVPVNLKDRDAFHLTVEEYLLALITLIDELARLSRNCVTLGDYKRPMEINQFIKDVHAGFGILNLKNDILRKRSDGIKYRIKECEDVVYDLSLRNLAPQT